MIIGASVLKQLYPVPLTSDECGRRLLQRSQITAAASMSFACGFIDVEINIVQLINGRSAHRRRCPALHALVIH